MADVALAQISQMQGLPKAVLKMINDYQAQAEIQSQEKALQDNYARNKGYAKEADNYQTELKPENEKAFNAWVQENKIPFNSKLSVQDYDMRGFWQALQKKDPRAVSAVDPNDNKIHYPDYWKTPYHETFSNESQWAGEGAPKWKGDQLIDKIGNVIFDDKKAKNNAR